ncbi:MAG: hypothetical protein QM705_01145 [Ancrocorticia sp.]
MSAKRRGRVGLRLPSHKKMTRSLAGLLAFGLLFPGGVAVAAPEVTGDDVVVTEPVAAPVESATLPQPSPTSSASPVDVVVTETADPAPVEPEALPEPNSVASTAAAKPSPSAVGDVVEFKDAGLKACVADKLGRDRAADITKADLATILELTCQGYQIVDIAPLQYATGLWYLDLSYNHVRDLSPLEGTNVSYLLMKSNEIADISPLGGFDYFWNIDLAGNDIVDVSPLAQISTLELLNLENNEIVDVSPLADISALQSLDLSDNRIVDISPLNGHGGFYLFDLADQEITLPDTTSGVPSSVPGVRFFDNSKLPLSFASGEGTIEGDTVTWNIPAGGYGQLTWSKTFTLEWDPDVTYEFSGTMTQRVYPTSVDPRAVVEFKDAGLKACVADKLGRPNANADITIQDIASMTGELYCDKRGIVDISPLQYATGIWSLDLADNNISDISLLAAIPNVSYLLLNGNKISDVTPLAGFEHFWVIDVSSNQIVDFSPLTRIEWLEIVNLSNNRIVDVSPVVDIAGLESLILANNQIVDVSPFAEFTSVWSLDLSGNQISDVSPLAALHSSYLYLSGNRITDVSPLKSVDGYAALDIADQKISLADATSGVKFTLPQVRFFDGAAVPVSVSSGTGTIDAGAVTWTMPKGGEGTLTWSKEIPFERAPGTYKFSGTLTQKVLPAGPVVEQPVASATPTIAGKARVGETLTAKPGKWTKGAVFTYQWLADGKAIKGATKATLVLKADQVGERISVKVTGSKAGYKSVSKTSAKTGAVAKGTLTTATPTISGNAKVGEKLTASPGKWSSGTKFAYQWYASGKKIKGATGSTFVVTTDQLGERITVKVTGSKSGYVTVSKTSAKTAVVAKGTLTAATPTISGTAKVGSTLTAAPGKWSSGTKFTYQWLADGKAIKNATTSSHTVKSADIGKAISVKVTGTKSGYKTLAKTSKATGKVTPRS